MPTPGEDEDEDAKARPRSGSDNAAEVDRDDEQPSVVALRPAPALNGTGQDSIGSENQDMPSRSDGTDPSRSSSLAPSATTTDIATSGPGTNLFKSAGEDTSTPVVGGDHPAQESEDQGRRADHVVAPSPNHGSAGPPMRAQDESLKSRHRPTPLISKHTTALTTHVSVAGGGGSPATETLVSSHLHRQRIKTHRDGAHAGHQLTNGPNSCTGAARSNPGGQDEHRSAASDVAGGTNTSRDKGHERVDGDHVDEPVPFAEVHALAPPLPGAVRVHRSSAIVAVSTEEDCAESVGDGESQADDDPSVVIHHRQDDEGDDAQSMTAMVEASLVTEPTLVEASPIDFEQLRGSSSEAEVTAVLKGQARKRRRLWIVICVLASLVVILVVGISVGLTYGSQESQATEEEAYLRSILTNSTLMALDDPGSPQYQAMQWVTDDNFLSNLDIDDEAKQDRLKQRFALAALFYATETDAPWRPTTSNWLIRGTNECDWFGCKCSRQGKIQAIGMRGLTTLIGYIPPEIGLLDQIVALDGGNTSLTGQLPSEIAALSRLTDLRLDQSFVSGTIPSVLGLLTNLEVLYFQGSSITGTMPTELAALTHLRRLRLGSTGLNGTIPPEFDRLSNLTELSLKNTIVGGTIPTELGMLSNLDLLELHDTLLRGTVPEEVCSLVRRATLNISVSCLLVSCNCGCECGSDLEFDDDSALVFDDGSTPTGGDDTADDY